MLERDSLVQSEDGRDLPSSREDDREGSLSVDDDDEDEVEPDKQTASSAPAPTQVIERQRGHVGHTDEELQEMRKYDLKRVKRIMANRSSAARSKVRKLRYTNELDSRISALSNEHRSLQEECYAIQAGLEMLNRENDMLHSEVDKLRAANAAADAELRPLKQTAHILRQRVFGPLPTDNHVDLPTYINLPDPEQLRFPRRLDTPQRLDMQAATNTLSEFAAPPSASSLNSHGQARHPPLQLGLAGDLLNLRDSPALNQSALPPALAMSPQLSNQPLGPGQHLAGGKLSPHLRGPHLGPSNLQLQSGLPPAQPYSLSHLQLLSNHLSTSSTGSGRSSLTALFPQAAGDDSSLLNMLQSMDLSGDLRSLQSDVSTQSGRLTSPLNWTGPGPSLSGIDESRSSISSLHPRSSLGSLPPLDRSLWSLMYPGASENPALLSVVEQNSLARNSGTFPNLASQPPQGLTRFARANSAPQRADASPANPWTGPWQPPQPQRASAEQLQHPWARPWPPSRDT